jgi:phage gp36-like protein
MYCTVQDIQNHITESELAQLTDDVNFTTIDQDKVLESIGWAASVINGYLRSRYSLPLSEVPQLIKDYCVDLALYRLHERRFSLDMPDSLINKRKFVIGELKEIQKGVISLNIEDGDDVSVVADSSDFLVNKTSADRKFPSSLLDKY